MSRTVLGMGSNLGDRLAHLQSVLHGLGPVVVACSSVYETAPWGGVEQQNFLNAVLIAQDPARGPHEWLQVAHELETAAQRERGVRWGPRSLDVDILDCDGARSLDPELTLPHPRAHLRAFVLAPWTEIDPAAVVSGCGSAVALLAGLPPDERSGVRRRADLVLGGRQ